LAWLVDIIDESVLDNESFVEKVRCKHAHRLHNFRYMTSILSDGKLNSGGQVTALSDDQQNSVHILTVLSSHVLNAGNELTGYANDNQNTSGYMTGLAIGN